MKDSVELKDYLVELKKNLIIVKHLATAQAMHRKTYAGFALFGANQLTNYCPKIFITI